MIESDLLEKKKSNFWQWTFNLMTDNELSLIWCVPCLHQSCSTSIDGKRNGFVIANTVCYWRAQNALRLVWFTLDNVGHRFKQSFLFVFEIFGGVLHYLLFFISIKNDWAVKYKIRKCWPAISTVKCKHARIVIFTDGSSYF